MIFTIKDLDEYLAKDKFALGIENRNTPKIFRDYIWRYQIILRKHEFFYNNKDKSLFYKIMEKIYSLRHQMLGAFLGFDISVNSFGPGLRINHWGYIVVNGNARIGAWCDIHQGVNIGQNIESGAPSIGDNVWICPGAKIFGNISIADGVAIGANAVVDKSVSEKDITVAGMPAKKIKDTGNPWKRSELYSIKLKRVKINSYEIR